MNLGYTTINGKFICLNCNTILKDVNDPLHNFCCNCGNPLKMDSAIIMETKELRAKIALLEEVLQESETTKQPCFTIVKQFLKELNDNFKD